MKTKPAVKKTVCPVSKEAFLASAPTLTLLVRLPDGTTRDLGAVAPREFSTGSFGWNVNAKTVVEVGGQAVSVQVGANLTVVGSKDAPASGGVPAAGPAPAKKVRR